MTAMAALKAAPTAISEPRPRYGMARTAPAVETVSGALDDGGGPVTPAVEEGTAVVPGTDAAEDLTPEEGTTGGIPTDGTPVSAGGAGGTTVAVSDGGPCRGAVAVDSTEVIG